MLLLPTTASRSRLLPAPHGHVLCERYAVVVVHICTSQKRSTKSHQVLGTRRTEPDRSVDTYRGLVLEVLPQRVDDGAVGPEHGPRYLHRQPQKQASAQLTVDLQKACAGVSDELSKVRI
jgi:hypothetical protein